MVRHRWRLIAWIGAALAAPIQAAEPVEAEFLGATNSGFILVHNGKHGEVLALEAGATLVGMVSPLEIPPGARVRFSAGREERGVRPATSLEVLPAVTTTDSALRVDLGELLQLLAPRPDGGARPTLVDLRSEQAFARGHLPGAISAAGWKRRLEAILPTDHEAPLVLYGESRQDAASVEALRAALRLGYRKARVYGGGYREWSDANRPTLVLARDVAKRIGSEPLVFLDVRPEEEAARGSLPRSVSVVPSAMRATDWTEKPALPTLVLVGRNAEDPLPLEVAEKLRRWQPSIESVPPGIIQILEGGFDAWVAAGGATEPPRSSMEEVPCLPLEGETCVDEFLRLWRDGGEPGAPLLLDIRSAARAYRPAWARHIPMDELPRRLSELPRDREIVIFCSRGFTSPIAQAVLARAGLKARFVRLPAPGRP